MREKFNHLYLDNHERKLLLHSLIDLKNQLIQQGRYTDCVDELIFKIVNAHTKKIIVYYSENVPLFRRNGYRKSGTMILRVRSRDTALK